MPELLGFRSGNRAIRVHAEEIGAVSGTQQHPAILLLHGSGGHIDYWTSRLAPFLAEGGIHLYAPHYFERTGTSRADLAMLTDGVHVPQWLETVDDALEFVASRPGVDAKRILLAGISLGAFLALALAAQLSAAGSPFQRRRISALIDISGGLVEPYGEAATRDYPPTLILHGASDNIVPVHFAHELDGKLTGLGVQHRTEILSGEGHWFSPSASPRLLSAISSFVEEHLQPQSK